MKCGKVFTRAWDRFALPWPFTRVSVVLGAPLEPVLCADAADSLKRAIEEANREALSALNFAEGEGQRDNLVPVLPDDERRPRKARPKRIESRGGRLGPT
jgi:hypothetical protein